MVRCGSREEPRRNLQFKFRASILQAVRGEQNRLQSAKITVFSFLFVRARCSLAVARTFLDPLNRWEERAHTGPAEPKRSLRNNRGDESLVFQMTLFPSAGLGLLPS